MPIPLHIYTHNWEISREGLNDLLHVGKLYAERSIKTLKNKYI